jgi:penicillin-binding protein 2
MLVVDQLKRGDPRLRWLAIGVLVGMVVLATGLWFVQVVNYKRYEENLRTQSFRTVRIPAVRGRIMDRNGVILAESRPSYNVNLYLEELRPTFQRQYSNNIYHARQENPKLKLALEQKIELGRVARFQVANGLVNRVSNSLKTPLVLSEKEFRNHYDARLSLPLPIVENLSPGQVAMFAESSATLPGVNLEVQSLRSYPLGETAAHILGQVRGTDRSESDEDDDFNYRLPDFKGIVGVEATFDQQLRGTAGTKSLLVNYLGYRQAENTWQPPRPGDDVILTINASIQQAAEKAMKAQGLGTRGAVVVLDPWTGDILALASAPAYDPNSFVPRITSEEYAKLNDPELLPQINRAVYAYPPGSIFKIVVGLAALESGTLNPAEQIYSPGYFKLNPRSKDPTGDTAGAGLFDFRRAFVKSSNFYFITNGLRSGLDSILDMGNRFCLGQRVGLPTRQEVPGYFPKLGTRDKKAGGPWRDGDTVNLCIGQGEILVSPLQMAVVTAAVANGGKVFWPRLVDRLERDDDGFRKITEAFPSGQIRNELNVSPHNLQIVQEAMRDDVLLPEGSGKAASVPGWQVCGKTGTAEVKHGNVLVNKITWFVSYAPFESPRYVVVSMVDGGRSGGGTCAPIVRRVYEALQKLEKTPQPGSPSLAATN